MLVYLFTDLAARPRPARNPCSPRRRRPSFNSISIDGDMSTNDTVLLLASGKAASAQPPKASPHRLPGSRSPRSAPPSPTRSSTTAKASPTSSPSNHRRNHRRRRKRNRQNHRPLTPLQDRLVQRRPQLGPPARRRRPRGRPLRSSQRVTVHIAGLPVFAARRPLRSLRRSRHPRCHESARHYTIAIDFGKAKATPPSSPATSPTNTSASTPTTRPSLRPALTRRRVCAYTIRSDRRAEMIKSFKHKGLEKFYATELQGGIIPSRKRSFDCSNFRFVESAIRSGSDMDYAAGSYIRHGTSRKDHWSVSRQANWRLTFRFHPTATLGLVDYQDYH